MIHKNVQTYLQFQQIKMARKIYHTISSTNVAIEKTINYIIEQNLVCKMLMPICLKLIFSRLLIKLATT